MADSRVVIIPFGVPDQGRGLGLGLAALVHASCHVGGGGIAIAQLLARKGEDVASKPPTTEGSGGARSSAGSVEAFISPAAWRDIAGRGESPSDVCVVLTGTFEPPGDGPGAIKVLAFDPRDGRTQARVEAPLDDARAGASLVGAIEEAIVQLGGGIGALHGLRDLDWEPLESVLRAEPCALHDPARGGPHDGLAAMVHLGRAIGEAPEARYPAERLAAFALQTAQSPSADRPLAFAATRALERAVDDAPSHIELVEALAALHVRFGRAPEAERRLNAAIVDAPSRPRLYVLLSQALRAQGNDQAALAALQVGLGRAPGDPLICCERGAVLASHDDFIGAASAWWQALAYDAVNPAAFGGLATLAMKQQDATTAQSLVDAALASPRSGVEVLRRAVQLALASEGEGIARASRVARLCSRLLELVPDDPWPSLALAQAQVVLGERDAARLRLRAIEVAAPRSLAASEAQFARLVMDDPSLELEIQSVLRAARTAGLEFMGDVAARARRLATLHQAWPGWYAAAIADRRRGCYSAARAALDVALEVAPGASAVHVELAGTLLELENAAASLTHAERAIALEGPSPRALFVQAQALAKLGRKADALQAAEKALAVEPGSERVRTFIDRLKMPARPSGWMDRLRDGFRHRGS